jgi:hypothetical protein
MLPKGWRKTTLETDKEEDLVLTNDGVRYANSIFVVRGNKLVECKLPSALLDSLELFDVPQHHPAFPGRGVKASKIIPADTVIGFYSGILRPGGIEWGTNNPYIFTLGSEPNDFVIDAGKYGNITRFINDPRGSHYKPNLCTEDVSIVINNLSIHCVQFKSTREIMIGKELLFPYEAGHEGYWENIEVMDITGEEMTIIKRESDFTLPTSPISKKKQKRDLDVDEREKRRIMPLEKFKRSIEIPGDGTILTLRKGNRKRRLQLFNKTTLIIETDGPMGSQQFNTFEKAYKQFQAEVAILIFWGWKITKRLQVEQNVIIKGASLLV